MKKFHILHYMPDLHILHGYTDVIDSLVWGLNALGYEVTSGINRWRFDATQIIFGAHFMSPEMLGQFPASTYIYNLEQLDGCNRTYGDMPVFRQMAESFEIWDYSTSNVAVWQTEFAAPRVKLVPIGYAPVLSRIKRPDEQDIDVLFYGAPSAYRYLILARICGAGLNLVNFCGLYGAARDQLISRAKVVLNLRHDEETSIFSIVRTAYLLANRKAVVSDSVASDSERPDGVVFVDALWVPTICKRLVENQGLRSLAEEQGYQAFAQRDITASLRAVLGVA
jgi:hypothetical protein